MNTHTQTTTELSILNSVSSQLDLTKIWHQTPPVEFSKELEGLAKQQHWYNFQLWHEEDEARNPKATNAKIAQVKRAIDRLNQQRNDSVEQLDEVLLAWVEAQKFNNLQSPVHSETPGSIVDRCSILALKIYHMQFESERQTANSEQRQEAKQKLQSLNQQQRNLHQCLKILLEELRTGKKQFKMYRQFKMYNDPRFNPILYKK